MSETSKYTERENTIEQLWSREMFLWKLRWGVLVWLLIWIFLPHEAEFSIPLACGLLIIGLVYNLAVSIAASIEYKVALSALTFTFDAFAITAAVYVTGGLHSELWPLYFLSVISSSIIVTFKNEISLLSFVILLYFVATAQDLGSKLYLPVFFNRIVLISIVTFAATFISGIERKTRKRAEALAQENSMLYERVNKFNESLEKKVEESISDLKKRYNQLEILYKIGQEVSSDIELDKVLLFIIKGVQEGLGFDRVGIFEVDEEENVVRGRAGVDKWGNPENIEDQLYLLNDDGNNFARIYHGDIGYFFTENADETLPPSQKKYMVSGVGQNALVPMKAMGKIIGMIAVDNLISRKPIAKEDLNLLMTFADQAAVAIHNARMFGKERSTSVKLKKLEELRSTFLSNMSHELRTPLASIKESISLMSKGIAGDVNEKQLKFLSIAESNTNRLALMIDELLDTSKMDAGEIGLEISNVDMAKIVDDAIFNIKVQADQKNIILRSNVSRDISHIHADGGKIFRVLTNLIGNSIKYSNEGSHISVSVCEDENELLVSVRDDGIGIDKEHLDNIFGKFYRIEDPQVKRELGVGLGLPISRGIIEAHGGRIWGESEGLGKGSTFTFALPKGIK